MSQPDPFGTAALRQTVLRTWQTSPTRFREDANAEEDLRIGGYRNRLLVELAQNAADAAGSGGVLRITFTGGPTDRLWRDVAVLGVLTLIAVGLVVYVVHRKRRFTQRDLHPALV